MNLANRLAGAVMRFVSRIQPTDKRTWLPQRTAGVYVTEDTALTVSSAFACIRVIAEDLATLPWRVHRIEGGTPPTTALHPNHPVDRLIWRRPNPELDAMNFRQTLTAWALSWGNGYAEIERNAAGVPKNLWPIPPDHVQPMRTPAGDLFYRVTQSGSAETFDLAAADMYHLRGLGWDGLTGYSMVNLMRRDLGQAIAMKTFSSKLWENGGMLGGVLEHPKKLSDEAQERLTDVFEKRHRGVQNSWRVFVAEEGMKYTETTMPLKDAQFLEHENFSVTEMCRWFRVPPHKVASLERSTNNNIEHQGREYVQDALMPWARRHEFECDHKLLNGDRRLFSRIRTLELMRGDTEARANWYKTMIGLGVLSINEVRDLEDLDPVTGGDTRFVPLNMTTLERALAEPTEPPEPDDDEGDEPDDDTDDTPATFPTTAAALTPVLCKEFERIRYRLATRMTALAEKHHGDAAAFRAMKAKELPQLRAYITEHLGAASESLCYELGHDAPALLAQYVDTLMEAIEAGVTRWTVGADSIENGLESPDIEAARLVAYFTNQSTPKAAA